MIQRFLNKIWPYIFAKPWSIKLNTLLFNLSIRGLGILNYKSSYISGEESWLQKYLYDINNPIVFDVGANIGKYSEYVFSLMFYSNLYAFEPHPSNFRELQNKFKAIKNNKGMFTTINSGVGDAPGSLELYDRKERDGSTHASLYQGVIEDMHHANSVHHTVDVITLDEFCETNNINRIDLLKIDTEGNELKCLMGARRLLERNAIKAIQLEFNEMNIISHATFKDFWDLLEGFSFARLLPGGNLMPIKTYSPLQCEIYAYQNIVAVLKLSLLNKE